MLMLQSMEDRKAYVKDMHLLKTDLFMKLIEEGQLPLRPGVKRLIGESFNTKNVFQHPTSVQMHLGSGHS